MAFDRKASSDGIILLITPRVYGVLFLAALVADVLGLGHNAVYSFLPEAVRLGSGAFLMLFGAAMLGWAGRLFDLGGTPVDEHTSLGSLVTKGPYRWSRNPIYVGYVALLFGGALSLNGVALSIAALVVFVDLNFLVIPKEELRLRQVFGYQYVDFCQRVRRWL